MAKRRDPDGENRDAREAEEQLRRSALDPEIPLDPGADEDDVDPDVLEVMADTQTLVPDGLDPQVSGEDLREHIRDAILGGGDVDVSPVQIDSGEEAVGGSTPTPDQDVVHELGRAAGVTYSDTEPLRPEEKEMVRDEHRWELDPASSEDYPKRQRAYRVRKKS